MKKSIYDLPLTKREEDILHLIAECRTREDIERNLGISRKTAECHIYRIMVKLHARKKEHLIQYAQEHGFGKHQEVSA